VHATGPGPCRPAPWTGGSAPALLPLPFLLPVLGFLILAGLGAAFLVRAFRRRLAALEAEAEALRQREARYRTVAGMGSDFAFSCVPAAGGGMVMDWITEAFWPLSGYGPEDLDREGCWLFCVPEADRARAQAALAALRAGEGDARELRLLTRSGATRWLHCRTKAMEDASAPRGLRIVGAVKDITARREAEDRLGRNRVELQAVYSQAPVLLCILNDQQRVLNANPALLAFLGTQEEALLARRICAVLGCIPPEGVPEAGCPGCALARALAVALATGESRSGVEHRMESPAGARVLRASVTPLPGLAGRQLLLCMEDVTERTRAEEALRERERRLSALSDLALEGVLVHEDLRIIEVNDALLRMMGAESRDALLGHSLLEFLPQEAQRDLRRSLSSEDDAGCELTALRMDGSAIPLRVRARAIRRDGRRVRVVTLLDLSSERRAQVRLREEEIRFALLVHNLPGLVYQWRVDQKGGNRFDYLSPGAVADFGLTMDDVASPETLAARLHPEDREAFIGSIGRAVRDQAPWSFDGRMLPQEGGTRWFHGQSVPLRDGEDLVFYGILLDITDRMEALEALRASERHFRELADAMPVAIATTDASGMRCTYANQAWCSLVEAAPGALLDFGWLDHVHPEDRPLLARTLGEAGEEGLRECEIRLERRDGEHRDILTRILPRRNGTGGTTGYVLTGLDLTERKRGERLASATEGILAKGRMAAYVAHEINGPLAGIKSAFQLLEDAIPKDHAHYGYVGLVKREINRIGTIVRTMYELYRPHAEPPREVVLSVVVQEVASLLLPRFRTQQVDVSLDFPDPDLKVVLRTDLLRQVLFNLLQNAIEASPRRGHVRVRARIEQEGLMLQIQDEGPGVPEESRERIFDPGFSTKRSGQESGLGLGLATTRRLVESMGGRVGFENLPAGGCAFSVHLPAPCGAACPAGGAR
jgi:PAS domain S-box-containing protein